MARFSGVMPERRDAISGKPAAICRSGQTAIRRDMVDCDYFRMLDGDIESVNAFCGENMTRYSWAELTEGRLLFPGDSGMP